MTNSHTKNPIPTIATKATYPSNGTNEDQISSSFTSGSKRYVGSIDVKESHIKNIKIDKIIIIGIATAFVCKMTENTFFQFVSPPNFFPIK